MESYVSTELTTFNDLFSGGEIVTQSAEDLTKVDALSNSSTFLARIQLYGRGLAVDKDQISKGHFGVPRGDEDIQDLGKSVDVLVIARRAKALDVSDKTNLIETTDPDDGEFNRIVDLADNTKDSKCMYGPSYLVYERTTNKFYEFFCCTKSSRYESSKINTYLPVTQAMLDAGLTEETELRGPKPMNLAAQYIERNDYAWFAPKVADGITPFDKFPSMDEVKTELDRFLKKQSADVKVVDDVKASKRR